MAIKIKHIKKENVDKRGELTRLLDIKDFPLQAILRITSKKGTTRANHWHKKDSHIIYIESGKCRYYEKPVGKPNAKITSALMKKGDMVLTKPNVIHAVKFLEDTVFYTFTTEKRNQKLYEKEITRVELVK